MHYKPSPIQFLPIMGLAVLGCLPYQLSAVSILLSAEDFTLLGGSAITSDGVAGTVITNGNVGLGPAAESFITGFPPAILVSGSIIPTGVVTNQARADLILAQSGLAGMSSNADLTGQDLGGLTLVPGVYSFSSTADITGTLTLNAQGQNNAFWVFQIGSALTTAAGASVNVINTGSNGGADLGVFWNAGSSITFGADNEILGNYLAGASITAGSQTNGSGRFLALAQITLHDNDIDSMGGLLGGDWTGGLTYDVGGDVVPFASEVPFGVDSTLGLAVLGAFGWLRLRRKSA